MDVAYQSSTSALTSFAGTVNGNHNVNPPAGLSAGELWIIWAVLDCDVGAAITLPSGWTAIGTQQTGQEGWPVARAFRKVAGAGETAVNIAYTGTGYDFWCGSIRVNGQHASTPIGNVAVAISSGTSNTLAAPTVTIQDNGNLALLFYAAEGTDAGSETIAPPAGSTTIIEREGAVFSVASTAYRAVDAGSFVPGNWVTTRPDADILDGVALTIEIRVAAAGGGGSGLDVPRNVRVLQAVQRAANF